MKNTKVCPKCGGEEIIRIDGYAGAYGAGNNVMVGAGAKILGPFRVGNNVKIAAGAVVLDEIPDDATAVGVPARVVRLGGKSVAREKLDQTHFADPVSQELCRLQARIDALEKKLEEK